jgi:hypothetical protein
MRNIMAQFTTMGLTKLVKNLKKLVYRSQTTQTQETQNDLKIPSSFRVVYPPNYDPTKRDFNNWIDNIYGK